MEKEHEKRKAELKKLKAMMNYPGRFPILLIGDTGVGKTHWIIKLNKKVKEFKNKIKFINSGLHLSKKEYWKDKLKKANKSFLVIEDIERLDKISQELLFDALSTTNGKYGFEKKNIETRIIFTSTFSIDKLRDDRRYLSAKFFDRISQFVVVLPNFEKTQTNIYTDFIATWEKFFKEVPEFKNSYPKSKEFITWLEGEAYRLHGNFRDLDKIVINWNLHQISYGKKHKDNELKILNKIKKDFKELLHNPSRKIYDDNTFVFREDTDYGNLLNDFKAKLKKWALEYNNNDKHKAARMLKISYRTMERWN